MRNSVIDVLLLITLGSVLVAFLFYRLSFSERTIFKGRMRLLQFLLGIVLPPIMILPFFQLYRMIERNPLVGVLPFSDDAFLLVIFCLIALASVGNGMHVAGVSIDYPAQNLDDLDEEDKAVLHVIEFFHHGFSHLIIFVMIALTTLVFFLFELNHPNVGYLSPNQFWLVVLMGLTYGVVSALHAIEGGSWRLVLPLYFIFIALVLLALKYFELGFFLLPVTLFVFAGYLSALAFLLGWGLYHGGFPEIMGELRVKEGHPKSPRSSRVRK